MLPTKHRGGFIIFLFIPVLLPTFLNLMQENSFHPTTQPRHLRLIFNIPYLTSPQPEALSVVPCSSSSLILTVIHLCFNCQCLSLILGQASLPLSSSIRIYPSHYNQSVFSNANFYYVLWWFSVSITLSTKTFVQLYAVI